MNIAAAYRLDRVAQQDEGERPMLTYLAVRRVAFTSAQQDVMRQWHAETIGTGTIVAPINAVAVACDGFMMAVAPVTLDDEDYLPLATDDGTDNLLMHARSLTLMRQYRKGPYVSCTIAENHVGYGDAVRFPRWSNWRPGEGREYPNWVQILSRCLEIDGQPSIDVPTTGKRFRFHIDPERAMTLARALNTPAGLRFSAASAIDGMMVAPSDTSRSMQKAEPMVLEGVPLPLPPFGLLMPRRLD